MAETLSPVPIQDYQINGIPAVGAKVFIYTAGTTTKITTYTDSTGGTAQTNPIILNSRGEPENQSGASVGIWLPAGTTYKMVFAPSTDTDPPTNPIWTVDNIASGGTAATSFLFMNFSFTGSSSPVASALLGGWNVPLAATLPANMASPNSYFHCDTNPGATFVMQVQHNGVTVGTISVTTGGVATFATTGGLTVPLAAGDRMEVFGPVSPDSTINNFFVTLAASFS
jgi:hypothetical protein